MEIGRPQIVVVIMMTMVMMMAMADAWLAMCQPSASSDMDPKINPEMISSTIVETVSMITHQVRRSLACC